MPYEPINNTGQIKRKRGTNSKFLKWYLKNTTKV